MNESVDVAQWAKAWEALARQAQSVLGGGQAAADSAAAMPPWLEKIDQINPFAKGKMQNEAVEHLLAGAQGYLGMLQSLANAAGGQATAINPAQWAGGFIPGAFAGSFSNPFAQAMRTFGGHGAAGFEQMFDRFAQTVAPMLEKGKSVLNLPAFGHLREKQENLQKTARVFMEYQEQSARYDRIMLKVGEQSFARFQLKLAEREEPGRQIESVRALYDLWIDAAEEAYAEMALSEEFREVYAGVVDAQMRVRQQVQGEVEKLCNEFGMPTRSEVDSIGERLQALRREFRQFQESWGAASMAPVMAEPVPAERVHAQAVDTPAVAKARAGKSARVLKRSARSKKVGAKAASDSKTLGSSVGAHNSGPAPKITKTTKETKPSSKAKHRSVTPARRKNAVKTPARRAAASRASAPATRTAKGSFATSIARFARKTQSAASRGGSK